MVLDYSSHQSIFAQETDKRSEDKTSLFTYAVVSSHKIAPFYHEIAGQNYLK